MVVMVFQLGQKKQHLNVFLLSVTSAVVDDVVVDHHSLSLSSLQRQESRESCYNNNPNPLTSMDSVFDFVFDQQLLLQKSEK